jgi:HD superfamily phosphodiesterase
MSKMIEYFGGDVRRINHALKVHNFAKNIGELENITEDKLFVLEIAAILHDIGIKESEKKYNSSSGNYQQIEGPPVAREILDEFNLSEEILSRVCFIIGNHHTYNKIDNIDFQVLVEADFLVNIYEDKIDKKQLDTIMNKYFITKYGKQYLKDMYMD